MPWLGWRVASFGACKEVPLFRSKPQPPTENQSTDAALARRGARSLAFTVKNKRDHGTPVLLLVIVLATIATCLCYRAFHVKYDKKLHEAVAKEITSRFPNTSVFVGHVGTDNTGAVIVSNVRLAIKGSKPKQQVFSAQRIVLRGDLDISDWIHNRILVKRADLYGVQIDVWPMGGNQWSIQCIEPSRNTKCPSPTVVLHEACLKLRQDLDENSPNVELRDISGTLEPEPNALPSPLAVACTPMLANFKGRSTGTMAAFSLSARLEPDLKSIIARGSVEGLHFSPALLQRLPIELSSRLSQLSGLECLASADFEVKAAPEQSTAFIVCGDLTAGRLQDPRLPYPLEKLSSKFSLKNSLLQLREMSAESGGAELELNSDIEGLGNDSRLTIVANAANLELDHRLYQSLPTDLQMQWDKLQLAGQVSGRVQLLFDGQHWTPSLTVNCKNVSFKPWLFPYPITEVQGVVNYQNAIVSSQQLVGRAGGQIVKANFSLERSSDGQSGAEWVGKLDCSAEGPVSIDEQLLAALTPEGQSVTGAESFVRSLTPTGTIKLSSASFERASATDDWHRAIDAHIFSGSINYAGFQYPIYDIRGRIVGRDDLWWLDQFEGRNSSGRILCSGSWLSVDQGNIPLDLRFEALTLPLDEELKLALPLDARMVWSELRPSGSVDRVQVRINRPNCDAMVQVSVQVSEDSSSNASTGRSLRIHPKSLPYWLSDVDCEISYVPGRVKIEKASAVNGASRVSLRGTCEPNLEGRWKANVEWLPQTRLLVDREFLKALPKSILESLLKVDFSGPISVLGNSEIVFANEINASPDTSWNCQLAVEDGKLGDGRNIGNLRGTVRTQGQSDGTDVSATGSLEMDALTIRDLPVTRLSGPFAVQGSTLYFGLSVADHPQVGGLEVRDMTANALSGKLTFSGHGKLDSGGKFYVDAALRSAQLSLLLKDLGVESTEIEALCDADLSFNGNPWNPQTYDGQGKIHLSEADLYQLPFMIRLMRVASVNASNDSAFQTADVDFDIDGDRIPFRKIACDGDVMRLRGEGWTNLRQELHLELYSYVGRRIPIANVVSPLLAESRYATFMLIEVDGTLDNPNMQRKPFPQLEATFQQIFPDLAENRSNTILPFRK